MRQPGIGEPGRDCYVEESRALPIIAFPDVLVVGGSPSGVSAAVAAARGGAKVLLIEQAGFLGGQAVHVSTIGQRAYFDARGNQIVFGIPWEIVKRCDEAGGAELTWRQPENYQWRGTWIDPETLKHVLFEMCLESGVEVLLDTVFCLPILDADRRVTGVIVENKSGRQAIGAEIAIDATGDADVAARAGAPFATRRGQAFPMEFLFRMAGVDLDAACSYMADHPRDVRTDPDCDPAGLRRRIDSGKSFAMVGFKELIARAVGAGDFLLESQGVRMDFLGWDPGIEVGFLWLGREIAQIWAVRLRGLDATDGGDLSRAEAEGRRRIWAVAQFFRRHVPGFGRSYIMDSPWRVGIRETRRIVGDYVLSEEDVVSAAKFPDTIGLSAGHDEDYRIPRGHELPYRCLLPAGIDGLLVVGRSISVEAPSALNATRGIVTGAVTGQAAGAAAYLAIEGGIGPRGLDVGLLRKDPCRAGSIAATARGPEVRGSAISRWEE